MLQPAEILTQAKSRHRELKELLQTREPWVREVESQRKEIRRLYLQLLLEHPYTHDSKDVETHLWMQTSYALIASYKQLIANLDRVVHPDGKEQPPAAGSNHGPVEYRKLLQRFRQFLAEEEKFWSQLIVRFRRTYTLDEVQPALVALELIPTEADGRSRDPLPAESSTFTFAPRTPDERLSRISVVYKALVWLGDTARYKEQYNESGGRPRAGREDGPPALAPRRGGRRRGGGNQPGSDAHIVTKARNYERAQRCYEQARLLLRTDGNASSQLAILATYKNDDFSALGHYYRALCVRNPWEIAAQNLRHLLRKVLEAWKVKKKEKRRGSTSASTPKVRVDALKENIVVLHALWKFGDQHRNATDNQGRLVNAAYHSLVSERHLPIATISDVTVLVYGALWYQRSRRDAAPQSRDSAQRPTSLKAESTILIHLLALHQSLWDVAASQIVEGAREWTPNQDLAQKITAVLRRMLPALRLAIKWTRANMSYLQKMSTPTALQDPAHPLLGQYLSDSWHALVQFAQSLRESFPPDSLPSLDSPLEEDIDIQGFLPFRSTLDRDGEHTSDGLNIKSIPNTTTSSSGVHPNVEQLMRISDILHDVVEISSYENSPVTKTAEGFSLQSQPEGNTQDLIQASSYSNAPPQPVIEEDTDESPADVPEDDPVDDAIRAALEAGDADEHEDDDQIVWDLSAPEPRTNQAVATRLPYASPLSTSVPIHSTEPALSPSRISGPADLGGHSIPNPPAQSGTTAQDLLNRFMGARSHGRRISTSGPTPQPLFGAGVTDTNQSIWSASHDEAFQFTNVSPGAPLSISPPRHIVPHSPWTAGRQISPQDALPRQPVYTMPTVTDSFPPRPPPLSTSFPSGPNLRDIETISPRYGRDSVLPQHSAHLYPHHGGPPRGQEMTGNALAGYMGQLGISPVSPIAPSGPLSAYPRSHNEHTDFVGNPSQPSIQPHLQHWTSAR